MADSTPVVAERQNGAVTVLLLPQRLTIDSGAKEFHEKVRALIDHGRTQILVDLSELTLMDSSALAELVRALTIARDSGGALKLLGVTPRIKELLLTTRLVTLFESFEREGEAVASFRARKR
jgi:anti-sigma B factor antagonist